MELPARNEHILCQREAQMPKCDYFVRRVLWSSFIKAFEKSNGKAFYFKDRYTLFQSGSRWPLSVKAWNSCVQFSIISWVNKSLRSSPGMASGSVALFSWFEQVHTRLFISLRYFLATSTKISLVSLKFILIWDTNF